MKKNTMIALIALWIGVAACAAFVIYGSIEMLGDCSHEIEDIIDAIADLAKEAWSYVVIVAPVAWVARKLGLIAINLYKTSTREEP